MQSVEMNPSTTMAHFSSFKLRAAWCSLAGAGYLVWLILLGMALAFHEERAFFMDAGFQLFNLVNEKRIQIYHYRFITAVPQVLPWLLLELEAPLRVLAIGFSASYILFHGLVYHLLVRRYGGQAMGWVLISLFTFISLDTFYHMQSEFYLGLSLLLLLFGIVANRPAMGFGKGWLVTALLAVTIAFSHKLSLIFFCYLWMYFYLREPSLRHRRYLAFGLMFLGLALVKSAFFTNWYEAAKQVDFSNNLQRHLPALHRIPAHKVFLQNCLRHYYLLPALMALTTVFQIARGHWLRLAMMWVAVPAYLLIYHISDPETPYRFYAEVSYLPSMLFVAIPFFLDFVPGIGEGRRPGILVMSLLLLAVFRLAVIAGNRPTIARQFDWIGLRLEQMEKKGVNRLAVGTEGLAMDSVVMEWGIPFTAMHLSSLVDPDSSRTVLVMAEFSRYDGYLDREGYFLTPFKVMKTGELNAGYYRLGSGTYLMAGKKETE